MTGQLLSEIKVRVFQRLTPVYTMLFGMGTTVFNIKALFHRYLE